jgi:hypothetical protein
MSVARGRASSRPAKDKTRGTGGAQPSTSVREGAPAAVTSQAEFWVEAAAGAEESHGTRR